MSSTVRHFETLVRECDAEIRAGRPQLAVQKLSHLGTSRIPREWRTPIAKLCRRTGLYNLGLRLLARIVCGPNSQATAAEITEYSALLLRSGAVEEALEKLERG